MKATPQWLDEVPAWERVEVQDHLTGTELSRPFQMDPVSFDEARSRREAGEPLEYILGHCHVGSITLKTDNRALIPRPETETLVRMFTETIKNIPPGPLLDCGTGSGFIAGWLFEHSNRRIIATDCSEEALNLTAENCSIHEWELDLVRSDRLQAFQDEISAVVANLPYVHDRSRLSNSVQKYEPREALFPAGETFDFYTDFFNQAESCIKSGGVIWLELTPELGHELLDWLHVNSAWCCLQLETDLSETDRFLKCERV